MNATFTAKELPIYPKFNGLNFDFRADKYTWDFCKRIDASIVEFMKSVIEDRVKLGCYQSFAMCLYWKREYLKIEPFSISLN